jgi:hypothetical protein
MPRAQQPARAKQTNNQNNDKARHEARRGINYYAWAWRASHDNARDLRHFCFESFGLGLICHPEVRVIAIRIPTNSTWQPQRVPSWQTINYSRQL